MTDRVARIFVMRRTFAAVFCVLAGMSAAQAGPWEVFEQRCLTPMGELAEPDLNGLIVKDPEPGFLVWQTREGWLIRTANGLDAPQVCMLSGFEWDAAVQDATFGWVGAALEADRFEPLEKLSLQSPTILRSTLWREPRIEMSYQPFDVELGSYLFVRETDLES